jgi:hypothetical protein
MGVWEPNGWTSRSSTADPLPGGIGVQLASTFTMQPPAVSSGGVGNVAHGDVEHDLVYASAQCTG